MWCFHFVNSEMNKRIFLILTLLFLIFFTSTTIYATIYVSNIQCSKTGHLSLNIEYGCRKDKCPSYPQKLFSEINITAISNDKTYTPEFDNPPESVISKEYYLISKYAILDPYKSYKLIAYDGEEKKEYTFKCPNTDFFCEKINLNIDLCMKNKLDFYYLFHGLENQFSEDDLRDKLNYFVNPANTFLGSVFLISYDLGKTPNKAEELPENFEVKNIGRDRYLLKVYSQPLKNKEMNYIYIDVKGCDKSKYNVAALKKCEQLECYSDEDCPIDSYCNEKTCKILLCQDCETIKDHTCISNCPPTNLCEQNTCEQDSCKIAKKENCCLDNSWCDDGNMCTKDECVNNRCKNAEIECNESDNPCVIGTCEEQEGCKYSINPKCEDKGILKTASKVTGAAVGVNWSNPTETISLLILLLLLFIGISSINILSKKKFKNKR